MKKGLKVYLKKIRIIYFPEKNITSWKDRADEGAASLLWRPLRPSTQGSALLYRETVACAVDAFHSFSCRNISCLSMIC